MEKPEAFLGVVGWVVDFHTTRNFPNRKGSKTGSGQMSAVALMGACSISATALKGSVLTFSGELGCWENVPEYHFNPMFLLQPRILGLWKGTGRRGFGIWA